MDFSWLNKVIKFVMGPLDKNKKNKKSTIFFGKYISNNHINKNKILKRHFII